MGDSRAQAKEKLGALIERVMADGKIEPAEREEMQPAGVFSRRKDQ